MKKWRLIVAASLFVLCLTAVFSWGEEPAPPSPERGCPDSSLFRGPMGPPGFGPGPAFYPGFEQVLRLSREQRDEIRKLKNLVHQETRDLRYKLAQKHLEFRKLLSDPKVDEETLFAKQKELIAIGGELQNREAQTLIKIRKILSPEQIGVLDSVPLPPPRHRMGMKDRHPLEGPCSRRDGGPDGDGDRPFGPRPQ